MYLSIHYKKKIIALLFEIFKDNTECPLEICSSKEQRGNLSVHKRKSL